MVELKNAHPTKTQTTCKKIGCVIYTSMQILGELIEGFQMPCACMAGALTLLKVAASAKMFFNNSQSL